MQLCIAVQGAVRGADNLGEFNILLADAPMITSDGAPHAVGAAAPSQVWAAVWTGSQGLLYGGV